MGKRGKRHVRMSSAAAAAQAGGASMTTAETMHAFKHAMAHSLGPAPAPSAARPGSKRIAQRRALAETSSGLNVRADVAPSPVKTVASNGVKPARSMKPPSRKALASLTRHIAPPTLPSTIHGIRSESSKENKKPTAKSVRDIVTADGSELNVLRSPLRRVNSAAAAKSTAKTPSRQKTPSRLQRTESAKTPVNDVNDANETMDASFTPSFIDVTHTPASSDADMESEIGAVVALAVMSGGKEAPSDEIAAGDVAKMTVSMAPTPFRAPAPVQMTPRAPPPSFFAPFNDAPVPIDVEKDEPSPGDEPGESLGRKRKTSPVAREIISPNNFTDDFEAARAAAALGRWRASYAVSRVEKRSERRVTHLVSLLREQACEFDAHSARFRESVSNAKSELRDAKGREEELRAALTASQADVDDLTELVGVVTRKSAQSAWRLAARAGVERRKRIKIEDRVRRQTRTGEQSAEGLNTLNDTLGDVSRALAATRAELEVAMTTEVKGTLKDSLRAKVADELRRELRESTMAELRREAREEFEEERRSAGGYARLAAIGAAAARAGGGMVTPAAALGGPSFPPFSSGPFRTPAGNTALGALHPYARMFPDVVSNRIPHQVRTSAVDVNPVTRAKEPSSVEEHQRCSAVAEDEIAAAAAAVRETDRMVLDAALKPATEYTPSEQLATLALQTAAKSRSPLNVLKGVDAGRLVRVHERAMESLASTMEETAKDLFAPITALTPGLAGGSVTATVVPPPGAGERKDGHELNASREREARGNASGGWGAWLNFSV